MPTVVAAVVVYGPVPRALMAATRNVYVVPFTRPVMAQDVAVPANTWVGLTTVPATGVTAYPVIGEAFAVAALANTVTEALPGLVDGNPGPVGVPTFTAVA